MLSKMAGLVVLALWFGGGVVAGFVVPPKAFHLLSDRQLAGSMAGAVLSTFGTMAFACGLVYVAAWVVGRLQGVPWSRAALILVLLALVCVAVGQWVVTPQVADLRIEMRSAGESPELEGRFGNLHRLSVWLFGLQWLLATAALMLHALRLNTPRS